MQNFLYISSKLDVKEFILKSNFPADLDPKKKGNYAMCCCTSLLQLFIGEEFVLTTSLIKGYNNILEDMKMKHVL